VTGPGERSRLPAAAGFCLIVGLLSWVLWSLMSGTQHHSYDAGKKPRYPVHLTSGNAYILSVHGGVKALLDRGVDMRAPHCEWSVAGSPPQALTVSPMTVDDKGTNAVASFVGPFTGDLTIACPALGDVFVDDADNAKSDVAGWFLVIGVVTLTVGVGLGLSAWRTALAARSAEAAMRDDDEIEARVDVAHFGRRDDEVGRGDRDDVLH
jgi:hypothetical protein